MKIRVRKLFVALDRLTFKLTLNVMTVEYQSDEILIRLPSSIQEKDIQVMINYFKTISLLSKNEGSEEDALELAREVDKSWWQNNRNRFLP